MTAVLLGAVGLVVVIGVAGALRRRLADERSSVRDYQHTLDTLRHLSDRRQSPEAAAMVAHAEPVPPPPRPQEERGPAAGGAADQIPARTRASAGNGNGTRRRRPRTSTLLASTAPVPRRVASYDSRSGSHPVSMRVEAPAETPADHAAALTPPPSRRPRQLTAADAVRELAAARNLHGSRPGRPSMRATTRGDRRPLLWTVVAVVVIGVITGVAVAEAPSRSSPGARVATTATTTASHRSSASAATAAKPSRTAPSHSAALGGLEPVSSSSTTATYQVSGAPYTLLLSTTTGACWVEATDTATGQVVWTGTLEPGANQSIPSTGGLLLRLGNSRVTAVTEDGQVVHLPPGAGVVFDLTFVVA